MDVYLSHEAAAQLDTVAALSGRCEGLLLGHSRAGRFFVESILPTRRALPVSSQKIHRILHAHRGAFLGVFSCDRRRPKPFSALGPAVMGKVFLEVTGDPESRLRMRAFLCDYDGEFRLVPLPLRTGKQGRRPSS